MKQEALAFFTGTQWSIIGMILFMIVFIGASLKAYKWTSKKHIKYMSQLPLEGGDINE